MQSPGRGQDETAWPLPGPAYALGRSVRGGLLSPWPHGYWLGRQPRTCASSLGASTLLPAVTHLGSCIRNRKASAVPTQRQLHARMGARETGGIGASLRNASVLSSKSAPTPRPAPAAETVA